MPELITPIAGCHFGAKLAKALGLQGKMVTDIVLECRVDNMVKVHYSSFVTEEQAEAVLELLKEAEPELVHHADGIKNVGIVIEATK